MGMGLLITCVDGGDAPPAHLCGLKVWMGLLLIYAGMKMGIVLLFTCVGVKTVMGLFLIYAGMKVGTGLQFTCVGMKMGMVLLFTCVGVKIGMGQLSPVLV
jgi:hypothetical protein